MKLLGKYCKEKIKYKKVIQGIKLKLQNKNKIKFLRVLILLKKIKLIEKIKKTQLNPVLITKRKIQVKLIINQKTSETSKSLKIKIQTKGRKTVKIQRKRI